LERSRRSLKIKINTNNILETALAIGIAAAAGLAIYYIGQKFFSFFSYQDMTREQVRETYKQVDSRLPILSRACKDKGGDGVSCRGIYLPDSGLMTYYHFDDNGKDANFSLYYSPWELWTTSPPIIPGLGGKVVQVGSGS
jgi:hypothetical protein